jgi:hypothetical protein
VPKRLVLSHGRENYGAGPKATHVFGCGPAGNEGRWQEVAEKMFIYATGWEDTPFTATYERLESDPAWIVKSLPTGHDIFGKAPEEFLQLVQELNCVASR